MKKTDPTLPAIACWSQRSKVWSIFVTCPVCGRINQHGIGETENGYPKAYNEHRLSHCGHTDYYLRIEIVIKDNCYYRLNNEKIRKVNNLPKDWMPDGQESDDFYPGYGEGNPHPIGEGYAGHIKPKKITAS